MTMPGNVTAHKDGIRRWIGATLAVALLSFAIVSADVASAVPVARVSKASSREVPVAAAKKPSKVKKLAKFRLSADGPARDSLRMQWAWQAPAKKYELQAANNSKFLKPKRLVVKNRGSRPAGGVQSARIFGLKDSSKHWLRARAIGEGGKKGAWSVTKKANTKVRFPEKITKVVAQAGTTPGTVKFTWKQKLRANTDYFVLDIARTSFGPTTKGKDHQSIKIPGRVSSYTLPAVNAAKSGAAIGSGNHLFYRFKAVRKGNAGSATRQFIGTNAVLPASVKPASSGLVLRVASYNVASAAASAKVAGHTWPSRRDRVAATILSSSASVFGLQELVSGNSINGGSVEAGRLTRQTTDLLNEVRRQAKRTAPNADFKLVRASSYAPPGVDHGTPGARILYDASTYTLLSNCPEKTGKYSYSESCTLTLPVLPSDSDKFKRRAAYARFSDNATGKKFWIVSAHLDNRADTATTKKRYENLRKRQVTYLTAEVAKLAGAEPVIVAGDLNSRPTNPLTQSLAQAAFLNAGYYDASDTPNRTNTKYPTYTDWTTKTKPNVAGFGARVDFILAKGVQGSVSYKVHSTPNDPKRASDHSLISAVLRLPLG